jgi:hypothetical protein
MTVRLLRPSRSRRESTDDEQDNAAVNPDARIFKAVSCPEWGKVGPGGDRLRER